jgi:hypothetical protein
MRLQEAALLKAEKGLTFDIISQKSGVSIRTIKRYFAGNGITSKNQELIHQALLARGKKTSKIRRQSIMDESTTTMLFPKELFKVNLFWSSPTDTVRNIDGVIKKYVESPNTEDLYLLFRLFGSARIRRIAKASYQQILSDFKQPLSDYKKLPEYQSVINMLEYFERQR